MESNGCTIFLSDLELAQMTNSQDIFPDQMQSLYQILASIHFPIQDMA